MSRTEYNRQYRKATKRAAEKRRAGYLAPWKLTSVELDSEPEPVQAIVRVFTQQSQQT